MAVEIERKFLVIGNDWRQTEGVRYLQGYLSRDKERTVRVRLAGDKAFLTIKSVTTGISRNEFEYEIPVADAEELLKLCDGPVIEKVRNTILFGGRVWQVDEFRGANEGLVVAEVELEKEDQPFDRPPWLGKEVSGDPRYFNSNLAVNPYCNWRSK